MEMCIPILPQAIVLIQIATISSQYMPQSYPYYQQQQPSMMPMGHQSPLQMRMPPMGASMPMSMPFQMSQRLPMVVMPQRSKAAVKKLHKKRKRIRIDSSEECSGEPNFRASSKGKRRGKGKKRHQVLTPVISYVTKEGYVVYQKKIKKEKAKDWLELSKGNGRRRSTPDEEN